MLVRCRPCHDHPSLCPYLQMGKPRHKRAKQAAVQDVQGPGMHAAGGIQQEQEVEENLPYTTSLSDLPDPCLGLLWARLDRASRIAFRRSCRLVRDSPSINAATSSLSLRQFQTQLNLQEIEPFARHACASCRRSALRSCGPQAAGTTCLSRTPCSCRRAGQQASSRPAGWQRLLLDLSRLKPR